MERKDVNRGDLSAVRWRKSRRSGASGGNCVEVTGDLPEVVAVRDSKNLGGPALVFTRAEWRSFVERLRSQP